MRQRSVFALAAAAALVAALSATTALAQQPLRIGAVAPKTGPLAAGAAITHWPNIQLWDCHQIEALPRCA